MFSNWTVFWVFLFTIKWRTWWYDGEDKGVQEAREGLEWKVSSFIRDFWSYESGNIFSAQTIIYA